MTMSPDFYQNLLGFLNIQIIKTRSQNNKIDNIQLFCYHNQLA